MKSLKPWPITYINLSPGDVNSSLRPLLLSTRVCAFDER